MNKKAEMTRREFLKDTAFAGAGAAVLGGLAPARVLGANDRIRLGVLGSGHRARYDMEMFMKVPGVEVVAVCDVFASARAKALEIAGSGAQAYTNYRDSGPQGYRRRADWQSRPLAQADADRRRECR